LQEHHEYGLDPVGFIDSLPRVEDTAHLPVPLLGDYHDLPEIIADFNIGQVVVAFGAAPESELVEILRTCDRMNCEIFNVPRLYEMHATTRQTDQVRGFPLVKIRRAPFRTAAW
jgi:FlaA1/EpsC-like NDP-sugar epimerase